MFPYSRYRCYEHPIQSNFSNESFNFEIIVNLHALVKNNFSRIYLIVASSEGRD